MSISSGLAARCSPIIPTGFSTIRISSTVLSRFSTPEKRIYLMAHFNHPRELTDVSIQAAEALRKAGVIVVNQTPILNGINNEPETLTTLFRQVVLCRHLAILCLPVPADHRQPVLPGPGRAVLRDPPEILAGLFRACEKGTVCHVPCNRQDRDGGKDRRTRLHAVSPVSRSDKHREVHGLPGNPVARWFDDYRHIQTDFEPKKLWLF